MSLRTSPRHTMPQRGPRQGTVQKRKTANGGDTFPVVVIGASAGGLETFRTLLAALPAETAMAFILVQHLDPSHKSMMVELLSPVTKLPVFEAREGMQLEPGHVYINPPGRYLAIRKGSVHLSRPPTTQAVRMPIDFLLQSLVEDFGERIVCTILSGTGTDGSVGAKAIKEAGGLVIAQDPDEAEYDGMPRSAIATGAVDLVLRLAKIPEALERYGGHRYLRPEEIDPEPRMAAGVAKIIDLLRKKTSHDFSLYKMGTLERRIERRMAMAGIEDSEHYLHLLTKDPAELERLFKDLFINVTRFFRDGKAFELLAKKIAPDLVRAQPTGQPIRVWVAGCSTGEEAYSIAMIFLEAIAAAERNIKLQIFATDVDEDALVFAREGLYLPLIETDVSQARLSRFFTKEDGGYRVSRELRSAIVFSGHDLIADAPFSRLDLISCRNLLIYLRPEIQQKVFSLFRFSLRDGGVLLLGHSETVRGASDYFDPISQKMRFYRHIGHPRPGDVEFPPGGGAIARTTWHSTSMRTAAPRASTGDFVQRLLLESYAPASVLVNRKHQGIYYFGAIDLYLKMATGAGTLDLLASAREGLRPAIRAAFDKASQGRERAVAIASHVIRNGGSVAVTVRAQPVTKDGEELVLLSFLDEPAKEKTDDAVVGPLGDAGQIAQVEQELAAMRIEVEGAIRDREIAEEEARAVNEEAMSVNEEFQSTNEELETSKEELQSLNEELTVLNSQLQETLEEHKSIANDLENILNSADLATLFLDDKLNIRFFTPAATSLFSVIASDVGRPLTDLAHHFTDGHLLADAKKVLASLTPITRDIEAESGASYSYRVLPYRTKDNHIEGVVITFVDITARKQAEDAANAAKLLAQQANLEKSRFLAAASHDLRQPLQSLSLLLGLLAKRVEDESAVKLIGRLEETLDAMSGMLNVLLDINQLEAGIVRPEITVFRVNALLERLKTEFAYHATAKGIDLRVVVSSAKLRSDPRLLEQMLRNLLANAVKFTQRGKILLGCRRCGDKLRIEVWDTGIGIPPEQRKAIFTEFHQIDKVARQHGLGLGLTIVDRLSDILGHTVDVRSWPGSGSVFAIEVPIETGKREVRDRIDVTNAETIEGLVGKVLIIEDDPEVREMLVALLEEEGHGTTAVSSPNEAFALAGQPDVIVADYNLLGELTGPQVVARLRRSLRREVPAIMLTGDISTDTLDKISRENYVYLAKPAKAEMLRRQIQIMLAAELRAGSREKHGPAADTAGGSQATIFLIDDDRNLLNNLQEFLQEHGRTVETYTSASAFLDRNHPEPKGCLVIDAVMPDMGGIALLKRLNAERRGLPAVMITGHGDVAMAVQAMKFGATDFLEKPFHPNDLLASIDGALERSQEPAHIVEQRRREAVARLARLTSRQRAVMDYIIQGHPNKIIAYELGISQRTVESHRASIMSRVGVKSLPDLVRLAILAE